MSYFPEYFSNLEEPLRILRHTNSTYFKLHRHNFLEFSYVMEGEGEELINDGTYHLKPGSFSVVLPYQLHRLRYDKNHPMKFFCVAVSLDTIFQDSGPDMALKEILLQLTTNLPSCIQYSEGKARKIHTLLEDMYNEYTAREPWWELSFKAKLTDLLISFIRERHSSPSNSLIHASTSQSSIWEILFYIYKNFDQPLSLYELSKKFNLSPNHISASFGKFFGNTYLDILHDIRIKHACAYLLSTDMSVTDIAHTVGYDSYRSFVRVFQKRMGMIPSEYRNSGQRA